MPARKPRTKENKEVDILSEMLSVRVTIHKRRQCSECFRKTELRCSECLKITCLLCRIRLNQTNWAAAVKDRGEDPDDLEPPADLSGCPGPHVVERG
jgi:hypothetical protein